jgi:K+-sensing histidine kinase KdpD
MSLLLVVTATAVYIGMKNLHILSAFYLFLLPIVLAQLMFGARCGIAAAIVSLVALYYFAIPPKNSFALQGLRELCLLAAFALWRSSLRQRLRSRPTSSGSRMIPSRCREEIRSPDEIRERPTCTCSAP